MPRGRHHVAGFSQNLDLWPLLTLWTPNGATSGHQMGARGKGTDGACRTREYVAHVISHVRRLGATFLHDVLTGCTQLGAHWHTTGGSGDQFLGALQIMASGRVGT